MTRLTISQLSSEVTDRDLDLLRAVERFRLLTTKQVQRLLFDLHHPTPVAAARACSRALSRLRGLGLLAVLQRRVGGVRAGSAGLTWYLGPAGDRLLRVLEGGSARGRRNYAEPSRHFIDHTLAVTELAVTTVETARSMPDVDIITIETEPASWQTSLSPHGVASYLKPDLRLVVETADEELHYFLEADLGTEHLPVIRRQCAAYLAYLATGRYQVQHGLFPAVIWVAPSQKRADAIQRAARAISGAQRGPGSHLFQVCTADDFASHIRAETSGELNQPNTLKGGIHT